MSAKPKPTQRLSGSSGINLNYKPDDPRNNPDWRKHELHYVFWASSEPLALDASKVGIKKIDPFQITSIEDFGRWERDQNDLGTPGAKRHPNKKKRPDEIWVTDTAGSICEFLERLYGAEGLVVFHFLTGTRNAQIAAMIGDALLPEIADEKGRYLPYRTLIKTVEENIDACPSDDVAGLFEQCAYMIVAAIERADGSTLATLDGWKSEVEQRRTAGTFGAPKMPRAAREMIRMVGKTDADYSSDSRAAGNAVAEQIKGAISGLNFGGVGAQIDGDRIAQIAAQAAVVAVQQFMQQSQPPQPAAPSAPAKTEPPKAEDKSKK